MFTIYVEKNEKYTFVISRGDITYKIGHFNNINTGMQTTIETLHIHNKGEDFSKYEEENSKLEIVKKGNKYYSEFTLSKKYVDLIYSPKISLLTESEDPTKLFMDSVYLLKEIGIFNFKLPKIPEDFIERNVFILKEKTKSSYKNMMCAYKMPIYKSDMKKDLMKSLGGGNFKKIEKI